MDGIERIDFDFSVDGGLGAVKAIEDILRSGHWSDRSLSIEDERTMFLLRMLRVGGIAVYRRMYIQKEETPEILHRAKEFNMFMNKRSISQTLLDIAGIFPTQAYNSSKTEYNSLFFPELKAFVRYGGIDPNRLFDLLARDGCEAVFLFSDAYADEDNVFYAITLAMPKKEYLHELGIINERIWESIGEAVRKADEQVGSIFPPLPDLPDDE